MAVGVGGSLTGRTPHLIVVDDPFKDDREAASAATRESVWSWFSSVVLSRALANGSGIVVMHTRWHEDDLVGRLLDRQGDRWRVLNYRLEAEDDDPLGRPLGAPLDPSVMGPDRIRDMHATMIPRNVAALYQQRPAPAGGALIRRDWLSVRYDLSPRAQRMQCDRVVVGVDLAFRGSESSDYCVAVVVGVVGAQRYVLHVERIRAEYPAQREMVSRVASEWSAHSVVVERAANGDALIAELSPVVPGLRGERAARDKVQRLAESGTMEAMHAGQVLLPRDADWMPALEAELLSFPASRHDDQVDALVWAMVAAQDRATDDPDAWLSSIGL
jgi:predicted phage terminase large subunit-like protein